MLYLVITHMNDQFQDKYDKELLSKRACDYCHERKIKCDMKGFQCSNCVKKKKHCTLLRKNLKRGPRPKKLLTSLDSEIIELQYNKYPVANGLPSYSNINTQVVPINTTIAICKSNSYPPPMPWEYAHYSPSMPPTVSGSLSNTSQSTIDTPPTSLNGPTQTNNIKSAKISKTKDIEVYKQVGIKPPVAFPNHHIQRIPDHLEWMDELQKQYMTSQPKSED
jgi:hypothetical protein